MGTLLVLALLGADPDTGWAGDEPAAATVSARARGPLESALRLGLSIDVGVSPSSVGQLGLTGELAWQPFRYGRVYASLGSAWMPANIFGNFRNAGAVRLVGGFDGVLPFWWGELFSGIASGTIFTNVDGQGYGCFDCGRLDAWQWQPTLRLRAGFDVTTRRPFVFGLDAAYALFIPSFRDLHWAELHVRLGVAL